MNGASEVVCFRAARSTLPLGTRMSTSFSLKSNTSDRELVFSSPRPDYFVVELRGRALGVTREVYAYTDAQGLSTFFAELAACERPWVGTQRWDSLEGASSRCRLRARPLAK